MDGQSGDPNEGGDGSIAVGGKNIPECSISGQAGDLELPRESMEPSTAAARGAREGGEREDTRPGARPSQAPGHEQELGTYYNQTGQDWTIWGRGRPIRCTCGGSLAALRAGQG